MPRPDVPPSAYTVGHALGRDAEEVRGADIALSLAPDDPLAVTRDRIASALQAAGLPDAALDARLFVEDATGLRGGALLRRAAQPVGEAVAAKLVGWVVRRLAGEPVFRILGEREFWGLTVAVTPDVLDPRPDTETLVEAALQALGPRRADPLRIADLGVGSGAILAALLSECPLAVGWGVDRSLAAARVARHNLMALGLGARACVLQGWWSGVLAAESFDLVVSNPPYIESAAIPTLDRAVRDHDPLLALDGGSDGLACYREITADLPRLLAPGGVVVFEVGAGQAPAVQALCETVGLLYVQTRRDLGGHERAVVMLGRNVARGAKGLG